MSFFMPKGAKQKPQYTGIQLQTSSSSIPLTVMWGMNRLSGNILWYDDFKSVKQKQKGGKGFSAGGTTYTYTASIILGLCQGPISGIGRVFRDQEKTTDYTSLGFSLFLGSEGQAPWGYLTSNHPSKALSYSNIAYVAAANYDLGSSASTPQHSFEVQGLRYNTGPLLNGDANCALVIEDLLTLPVLGVNMDTSLIDFSSLKSGAFATTTGDNSYETYCRAAGFGLNPVLSNQEPADSVLGRWTLLTNTSLVWTGYSLKFIPYATEEIIANGYHYLPSFVSSYTLTDDDFIPSDEGLPFKIDRKDPSDCDNSLSLIIKDRANEYNEAPMTWKDQGLIDECGLRTGNNIDAQEICTQEMGTTVVSLIGQRLAYSKNTCSFRVPPNLCLIEPMDILTLVDPVSGVLNVWVEKIEEKEDFSLMISGIEVPPGLIKVGGPQAISNNPINQLTSPGPVNAPLIFQPPLGLTEGRNEIWAAVSGGNGVDDNPNWGGCFIYVSTDNVEYQEIGTINSAARMGILSAALPDYTGTNPDTLNTLPVNLRMSDGVLQSVTATEAQNYSTLCYVGGELISFQTATLTSLNSYSLSTLYRGLYGTDIAPHPINSPFARIDENVFKYRLPENYIGIPLYFKLQSFNIWGSSVEDLSSCVAYPYTPIGLLPPIPKNLRLRDGGTVWTGDTIFMACDSVEGATEYKFYFYNSASVLKASLSSPIPFISYTSNQAGMDGIERTYEVRVSSVNPSGESTQSESITIHNGPPSVLTGVTATGGATVGTVSWTASTETDLIGYVVFYHTVSGFDPETEGFASFTGSNSISLYGLGAATYYAVVAAYDPWSFNPSVLSLSSEVSFTITSGGGGGPPSGGGGPGGGYGGLPGRVLD